MRRAPHRDRWLDLFEAQRKHAQARAMKSKLLVLAPRDHGKSEAAITMVTRAICLDRNARILWVSESQGQAEKRLRRIKALLRSARIVEDWTTAPEQGAGPFLGDGEKWSASQIYVARSLASIDATLEGTGAGGAVTGGHFDLIVCDDLQDDRNVYSASVRSKTREWWRGTISPMLLRGGAIICIGTRKHFDDLYAHLIADPTWHYIHDKAVVEAPSLARYKTVTDEHGREMIDGMEIEGGQALWSERPLEHLLLERRAIGSRLFSREYQNEVQDDSAAPFKQHWLDAAQAQGSVYTLGEVPSAVIDIVQGWDFALVTDPARAERSDSDFTVGITWGRDSAGNRYLIDLYRRRGLSPAELQAAVKGEYAKYKERIRIVAVEKNAFGELHFMGLQRTTDLPLKAHLTTQRSKSDPWEGVPSLSILFENGKVILPSRTSGDQERLEPLLSELWGLGKEAHDDTVMALYIAETWLRKSAFTYTIAFGDSEHTGEGDERLINHTQEQEEMIRAKLWADLDLH